MLTTFDNKYKDRTPEDTIKTVKEFFQNRGCEVVVSRNEQSECGSWFCVINLRFEGKMIARSNGKGATEIYSLASGHAELYERFCNLINTVFAIYVSNHKYRQANFKEFGYYFDPKEKEVSYADAISASPRIGYAINGVTDTKGKFQKFYTDLIDNFIAVPYKGMNMPEPKWLVPELVILASGSDGMAAGNTLQEALVQGTAEIFEHYIWNNIYTHQDKFFALDIDKMEIPKYLRSMINRMRAEGLKLHFVDFSYNYHIPVLGLFTINPDNCVSFLNLGASPVFDIALERIITETYQGRDCIKEREKYFMLPSRNYNDVDAQLLNMTCITQRPCYLEDMLTNFELKNNYNTEVFLENFNYSNEELYNYFVNLENKLGWNVYYRDWSLSDKMFAVHVFVDNIANLGFVASEKGKETPDGKKVIIYNNLIQNLKATKHFFDAPKPYRLNADLTYQKPEGKAEQLCTKCALSIDPTFLFSEKKTHQFQIISALTNTDSLDILYYGISLGEIPQVLVDILNHYKVLLSYGLNSNKYTIDEIKAIAQVYGVTYTEEDYANCSDINYYIYKLIYEPAWEMYNSDFYNRYIDLLRKKDNA